MNGEAGATDLGGEAVGRCRRFGRSCRVCALTVVGRLGFWPKGRDIVVDGLAGEIRCFWRSFGMDDC